jgi:hypothetical protein
MASYQVTVTVTDLTYGYGYDYGYGVPYAEALPWASLIQVSQSMLEGNGLEDLIPH